MHDQPTDYSNSESFPIGRRRKPNFTDNEVLTIVNQYDKYKEFLHSREASKSVIAQKQAIWKQITETLNASYPQVERTVEDVRRKWKKLQSEAKRESAAHKQNQTNNPTNSIWNKQMNLYERILSICRPSLTTNTSQYQQLSTYTHQQIPFNEQSSDKLDSPSSDPVNGLHDSPGDESTSLILDNDENPSSPVLLIKPSQQQHTSSSQVSKRTLDKRRKLLKSSVQQSCKTSSYSSQQTTFRYELLLKRKRILELTSEKLSYDRECLLIEKKNLEIKFSTNECEIERNQFEQRRLDSLIQKYQTDLTSTTTTINGNHTLSDFDEQDDNNSFDEMSDYND